MSSKDDISESGSVSNSTSVIDIYHRLLRPTRGLTSLSPGPSNGDPDATNAMNDRASSTPIIAEPAKQKFTAKRTTWPKARSSALPNVMNQVHDVTATDSRPIATTSTTTPTTAITTTAAPTTATSAVDAGADPRLVVRAPAPPPIPTTTPPILPRSALATESAEILDGPHDFELVSYNDAAIGITWNRAKSDDPGMKLYKRNSGKLLCPVERSDEIGIDPSIWDRIHLQSTVDNSIITVSTMADPDQKITMMFGRRPGDDTVAAGKMQARQFISWLRKQREAIGMQLLVGSG